MSNIKSITVMTMLNIATSVVAVISSVIVARYFGSSREIEVFFMALTLQGVITKMSQTSQLGDMFLPVYLKTKASQNHLSAIKIFSVLINWTTLIAILIVLALLFLAEPVFAMVAPGFENEDYLLGVDIFKWILPLIILQVQCSLYKTLSNAEKLYGKPEAFNLLASVLSLICVVVFVEQYGVWAMVISLWVGWLTVYTGLIWVVVSNGYKPSLILSYNNFGFKNVRSWIFLSFSSISALQLYTLVLNAAITALPQGTYAIFKYIEQIYSKLGGILMRPVSTVFLTDASDLMTTEKGRAFINRLTQKALSNILFVIAIVVIMVWTVGDISLGLLWGKEKFSHDELSLAIWLLSIYFLMMPISGLGAIGRKLVIALGFANLMYILSSSFRVILAVLTWFLITQYGTNGVVMALFMTSVFMCLAYFLPIAMYARQYLVIYSVKDIIKWLLSGYVSCFIGITIKSYMYELTGIGSLANDFMVIIPVIMGTVASIIFLGYFLKISQIVMLLKKCKHMF